MLFAKVYEVLNRTYIYAREVKQYGYEDAHKYSLAMVQAYCLLQYRRARQNSTNG